MLSPRMAIMVIFDIFIHTYMSITTHQKPIGIIGMGSFGTAIALLISKNADVLCFTRNPALVKQINEQRFHKGVQIPNNVRATHSPQDLALTCRLIFPVIRSVSFRSAIKLFSPYLTPEHILIHGTKGFDISSHIDLMETDQLMRTDVHTMSEVIRQETPVLRTGCLSGPNLAREILDGKPTATVIASPFDEVIEQGQLLLSSDQFFAFGSHDIKGAEIAGALKNIIAIGSGILAGLEMGKNIEAMLITRGLHEIIHFGETMGATSKAFLGTAGIGDLVATATTTKSRNYTFGYKIGQGMSMQTIIKQSEEVIEGVRTLRMIYLLSNQYHINTPICNIIYRAVYDDMDIRRAIKHLMRLPQMDDVLF